MSLKKQGNTEDIHFGLKDAEQPQCEQLITLLTLTYSRLE